jgi:hypothetical protein
MSTCPHSRRIKVIDKLGPMTDVWDPDSHAIVNAQAQVLASHWACLDCGAEVNSSGLDIVRDALESLPADVQRRYARRAERGRAHVRELLEEPHEEE